MINTLLDIKNLPKFSQIKVDDIEPTIKKIIEKNKADFKILLNSDKDIESLIIELENMGNLLSRVWSPISHLNSVMNTEELREAHDNCLPYLSEYSTEQAQNTDLFKRYKKIKESKEFNTLDIENKKIIDNELLKFKLNGISTNKM